MNQTERTPSRSPLEDKNKETVPLLEDLALSSAYFPSGVVAGVVWSWLINPLAMPILIHNVRTKSTRNFYSFSLNLGTLCGYIGGTYAMMHTLGEQDSSWRYLPLITNFIGISAAAGFGAYRSCKKAEIKEHRTDE